MNRARLAFLAAILPLSGGSHFSPPAQEGPDVTASAAASTAYSDAAATQALTDPDVAPTYGYKIIKIHPHDPRAFTQGLIFHDGFLYESTGLRGQSSLRKVELETGNVLQEHRLQDIFFGEGLTLWKNRLIQLTWQSRIGFVYDRDGFDVLREFTYPTEGWGLTHDGAHLIMSDGTASLYFLDPMTFERVRRITVRDRERPQYNLNELEYIKDKIYANIWLEDRVAIISPQTGHIIGWIDLEGLLTGRERARANVLNGIAYDAAGDRLFVTGKFWPKLLEIELIPKP